jgi:hypothetical protein
MGGLKLLRHIRRADFLQGLGDFRFAKIFKPEVNVLGDDGRTLQGGGGKPDDHEPHLAFQQDLQQALFTFGEWQWRGHGLSSFAIVPTAVAPAKSGCAGRCRGQLEDER